MSAAPGERSARIAALASRLAADGIGAALFEDAEGCRDQAIRYLSGQPGDALLVVSAEARTFLVAWDLNLARLMASADGIVAYSDYSRLAMPALADALARTGVPEGSKVELPSGFAYLRYVDFVEGLPGYDLVCREDGADAAIRASRAVKDAGELAIYRKAAAITNRLIDEVEAGVRAGRIATELEAALFLERASREAGCEGMGFETIAAGPSRSWGIHAFPAYGAGPFATEGMSILDFGVKLEGYTTDVTMSFVRGSLGAERERMIGLVEKAHREAVASLRPGLPCRQPSILVDAIFAEAGMAMPHGLGHGVGLEAHEAPAMRNRDDCVGVFAAGQVVTIEPGLYHPELGGVRLEDDVLITEAGHETLTKSRIVRL